MGIYGIWTIVRRITTRYEKDFSVRSPLVAIRIHTHTTHNTTQWRLGSFESEEEKSRGHGKGLVEWTEVTIKTREGRKIKRKRETETRPFNKSHLEEVDDIATMNGMNRASLINALRRRFQQNENGKPKPLPYTYVSDVLLMMNPFCGPGHPEASTYYDHLAKKPPSKEFFERGKVPHIRAVGDFAYDDMVEHEKNQAIIVSGESGSGKTFSCGLVLERLTEKSLIAQQKADSRRASLAGKSTSKSEKNPFLEKIKQVRLVYFNSSCTLLYLSLSLSLQLPTLTSKQQQQQHRLVCFWKLLEMPRLYEMITLLVLESISRSFGTERRV